LDLAGLSDEDLMRAVCADDSAAFDALVGRFQARLFHFALRRVYDRQIAEDVVQETLLKVWRHKDSFHHGSRLSTWIFALSLNLIRDHWRRTKPESSLERPEVALAAEHSSLRKRRWDASDEASRNEMAELLLQALGQLPAQSAELLKQRSQQDLTLEDAGRLVGLGPDAARAAASRAYKKMKNFLNKRMD
jgi:RNA polymerase sigma factor (sigma-70 family)